MLRSLKLILDKKNVDWIFDSIWSIICNVEKTNQTDTKLIFASKLRHLLFSITSYADMPALYRLSRLNSVPRSRIVNPCNGGTVYFRFEFEPIIPWRACYWVVRVDDCICSRWRLCLNLHLTFKYIFLPLYALLHMILHEPIGLPIAFQISSQQRLVDEVFILL